MQSDHLVSFRRRRPSLLLTPALLLPFLLIAQGNPLDSTAPVNAGDRASDHAQMSQSEVTTALSQLDTDLARLSQLAEAAPTPEQKVDAKARYAALKQRSEELKKEFDRDRFEALKSELQSEIDRVSAFAKDKPSAFNSTSNRTGVYATEYQTDPSDRDLLATKITELADPMHKTAL